MQLAQLLRALQPPLPISEFPNLEITRITADSRQVIPGALFVAYPGINVDGAQFIPDAVQRGAAAIVTQANVPTFQRSNVPTILVPNARAALAQLAAAWYHHPTRNLRVIGVTGTDGKTTTCTLIENILLAAGHTVGSITTVAAHIGGQTVDTGFHTTTPDAPTVQAYLAQMVELGTEYAVLEATSHGLAQHRLEAVDFDIAVITNITHEHLDLHGSWENYRDAKAMLFRALSQTHRKPRTNKVAVLNADDNARGAFDYLRTIPVDERVIYSAEETAVGGRDVSAMRLYSAVGSRQEIWIRAYGITHSASGLHFGIHTPFGQLEIESPLIGRYNVSNILAAVGAALGRRIPFAAIEQGVKMTRGIVGRMERIEADAPFTVIVDFAHTPYALENALQTGRELVQGAGRLIVVFGCAGLRDVQKRAWMGEIAGRLADLTVVTAEDPRTESLDAINAEIARGLKNAGRLETRDYFIVEDRGQAIEFAIQKLARPGDVIMICGKGHERSMCFGTTEYPWSDQEAVRAALEKK